LVRELGNGGYRELNKVVIFDFDGVIIDSLEIQKVAYEESYQDVVGEAPARFDEFITYSGDSLTNIFKKMNLPPEMIIKYREVSRKRLDLIKIYPGVKKMMENLRKNQFKCGLCTGKDRERTIEILKEKELDLYFDVIVCSDDVNNPKPHAESLQVCMEKLSVKEEHCLMVGDARNDILCAKNAKVASMAVCWGTFEKDDLLNENPDYCVETFAELHECINHHFTKAN